MFSDYLDLTINVTLKLNWFSHIHINFITILLRLSEINNNNNNK